jgi:hypothetical protein
MELCKKCILPESFPDLTIEEGICSFCRNWHKVAKVEQPIRGADELLKLIKSKKKTQVYDCLVPLSGGKDSSYVLYYIVRELGLRPLAAFFDNGFATESARRNVELICRNLSVDLVVGRATPYRNKLVREALYVSKYLNKYIKSLCGNCENNNRTFSINEARKRKLPFIIWGSTDIEDTTAEFPDPDSKSFRESFGSDVRIFNLEKLSRLREILKGTGLKSGLLIFYHLCKYMYYCVRDNIKMGVPRSLKMFYPFLEVSFQNKDVETIYFYQYVAYDPEPQREILEKETGWSVPIGGETKSDCALHYFVDYQHLLDTGISATGVLYSALIRNGSMNRDIALEREKIIERELPAECDKIAKSVMNRT